MRENFRLNTRRGLGFVSGLLALLFLPLVAAAQPAADAVFSGFQPNGDLVLELDGNDLKHAELFFSERAGAFLIMAPELSSPILVGTRTGTVESVHLMKVAKRDDGSIDLLADAAFQPLGRFTVAGTEVNFDLKGQKAKLKPKPALVGFHKAETLKNYKPDYGELTRDYSPSNRYLETLRGENRSVKVVIYFGTWCPTCSRLVPRVLRIAEELEGSKIDFQYYGLPRQIMEDPAARRDDIHGVPTGIVYVGDKEVGRLGTQELNEPEGALSKMLSGS